MTRRSLAAACLAFVLSLGLAGVVSAEDGLPRDQPTDPGFPTDPAFPEAVLTGVSTDRAPGSSAPAGNWWWYLRPPPSYEGGVESGAGLSGTYLRLMSGSYRYIPAFQYQGLYSDPQGWWSCTAYSTAMAVDRATGGGSRITGRQIRALTGVGPNQGLTLPQVMRATDILAVPIVRPIGQWSAVMAALKSNRGVVLQGDYDQIPDSINLSTFDGYHAVYLDRLHSDGIHIYMMDPLRRAGPVWVDASILRKFAEKLTRQEGVYPMVLFTYTRATRLFH